MPEAGRRALFILAAMSDTSFADLISRIAHELRSPLTAVQGFSGTLVKRWDRFSDEQRLRLVETVYADAQRMGRIISEVLDLARMETGRLELVRQRVNLAAVAARAGEAAARLPGSERLEIDVGDELEVWADAARLEHILNNLVENGIKYSEAGPVELSARPADGMVAIAVRDRGVGIAPERIAGIFSGPAPPGQGGAPSGSGLGLYLTKRLVEAHGGTVSVESTPEAGSTFTVLLPQSGATSS